MALILEKKKEQEEIFPAFEPYISPKLIPRFPRFKVSPVVYLKPVKRERIPRMKEKIRIDDTISRVAIWRALFKDKPMPNIEKEAVEKYAGSLDKYLPPNIPIDKVVRHAKG